MTTRDATVHAKKRPSNWWFVLAGAIFVVSLIPTAIAASSLVSGVRDYRITPVENDSRITIGDDQVAIFGKATGDPNDHVDAGNCELSSPSGETISAIDPTAHVSYNRWHRIALAPKNLEPGEYRFHCEVPSGLPLGVADNPPIFSSVITGLIGVFSPILGGSIALVILVVVIVLRVQRQPTIPPQQ